MSRAVVIQPTDDLIRYVADQLRPEGKDYSRNLVIFPGRRPAHFLRRLLATREGSALLPPLIYSIDDLVEAVSARQIPRHGRKIDTLDAVAILYDLHRRSEGRIGGDHFMELDRFYPLGEKLFAELEELKLGLLSPEAVAEQTSVMTHAALYTIPGLYESFYRTLDERGLTTRALDYARVAEAIDADGLGNAERVVVGGLYALTHAERVVIRRVADAAETTLVFVDGPGLTRHLELLEMDVDHVDAEREEPSVEFVRAPDIHGQVGALGSAIRRQEEDGGLPDERSVLVLPRPDALFPVVNHLLPGFSERDYNISMGYPLGRTPLSGLFHGLAEAVERRQGEAWFVPDYLRVMLHPYVKNIRHEAGSDVTRILIHTVEEWLSGSQARSLRELWEIEENDTILSDALLRIGNDSVTVESLRMHLRTVHAVFFGGWKDDATVREFTDSCMNVVRYIHETTTATRHPYFRSFSERMMDGLHAMRGSLLADESMGSARSSFSLLHQLIASTKVPFPGSPLHGFQVLGLLETRGIRFENVYVIDANDDVLPPGAGSDQLLPEVVRRKLGLETQRDREQITEYYLSVLFSGARRVWIAWDESNGKERSRYVEQLMWRQEKAARSLMRPDAVPQVRFGLSLHADRPTAISKTTAEAASVSRRSLSAGALDAYLRCQLRFYYRYVLGLSSPDETTGDIEAPDIGTVVHRILQKYFHGKLGKPLDPKDLSEEDIQRLAVSEFAETFGPPIGAGPTLMQERIAGQLVSFLSSYQRPLAAKARLTILSVEEDLEGSIGRGRFRVRTDRIEECTEPGGTPVVRILDYKTGGDESYYRVRFDSLDPDDPSTWYGSIGSFQLFLYTYLYASSKKLNAERVEPAYLMLGKQTIDESIETGLFGDAGVNRKEALESMERIVTALIDELQDQGKPFRPTDHLENECPGCPYTALCGTTWTERRGGW